jgi:glycosyltransferase involved in cell wall biosynthesis
LETQASPIRVTYVIGSLAIGGAETQLVRLANRLDRHRFRPSIICLDDGGALEATLVPDVPVIGVDLSRVRHGLVRSRSLLATRILAALMRQLHSLHPEVVHAYLPVAYVLGSLAAWTLRVPGIVAGRRGLTSFEAYPTARWRRIAKLANRVIDVHICNSMAVRDFAMAREGIPVTKTRVIHNGIDIPALARTVHLPPGWPVVGPRAAMVANLIRYKGHREVLQAVSIVKSRHPSFRLVLMGEGPERARLQDQARDLGIEDNIVFAGSQAEAATLVQAFDFTILGSSEEGFPNAVMESMASAIPVISTAVGGVAELVEDGVDGRLVPYGDPTAMAGAISWMIDHPEDRHRMGQVARQRIADRFSTELMVRETEAVYEELLGRHARKVAVR